MTWSDPATAHQVFAITRLAISLGIRYELEQLPMSRAEARQTIYDMRLRLKSKGRRKLV